ncbi:MAG: tRNA dihydrouridine synthase DusB [Firmicutes bacterium]|nr:tRNA dihydrouridine synthase DusB [Bacillota bacterium]MDD4336239.1 tRNA dihydrouridine synthase DusB [Bacillota bacterium]MDD4791914.1 tRNA dihydrouridine synthase DusB [Bacillota bacterium]
MDRSDSSLGVGQAGSQAGNPGQPPSRAKGFSIGTVHMENPLVLAPMAGVCDAPFRRICREMGCALTYTEMVSGMALVYANARTVEMLTLFEDDHPIAVQIFGSNPGVMAQAAAMVERAGADIIDINMGCPVPKIVKNREGSALMRDPELAWAIVRAVRKEVCVPVTVKIRKGWDDSSVNAIEFAKGCAEAGADGIAVHGRTREQGYSGEADWHIIAQVADAVDVPVIGNGDVTCAEDALGIMEQTGCVGVMIGRGALGNPWIFQECLHYLNTGDHMPEPELRERVSMALRHLDDAVEFKGEGVAVREMRKHLAWYIRGLRGAARMREAINSSESVRELRDIMLKYSS